MNVVYPQCAGLEVTRGRVKACRLGVDATGRKVKAFETFGITISDLLRLSDWLTAGECTHVALGSAGKSWRPVWDMLEGNFELLLVDPQNGHHSPMRMAGAQTAEWLADLLQQGSLQSGEAPLVEQRDWRELLHQRTHLVRERTGVLNRLSQVLDEVNVKFRSTVPGNHGASGRAFLEFLLQNTLAAERLAEQRREHSPDPAPEVEEALTDRLQPHRRFLIAQHLAHLEFLGKQIAAYTQQVESLVGPSSELIALLDTIPGLTSTNTDPL